MPSFSYLLCGIIVDCEVAFFISGLPLFHACQFIWTFWPSSELIMFGSRDEVSFHGLLPDT